MAMKRAFVKLWCITVLSLICGIDAPEAEAAPCIPADEAAIDGYVPGQNKRVVEDKPKPLETKKHQGEDDGGAYTATLLTYKFYRIVIVRDSVDSVTTASPAVVWAKNIKIGDVRAAIDRRVGYAKVSDSKDEAQYLVCSDAGDVYAILRFSSDKLASIEMVIDRP